MTTKFDVGDPIVIEGVVEYIHIETTDNEAVYHVRIKGAGSYETYCIRVKEDVMKSIESLSRPKGEWIIDNEHTKNPLLWYKCNLCDVYHSPTNFCPNCGADMRKESKKNDI